MNKKLENKTEGMPAMRLNLQTKGANGLSQTLNFPTPNGEESAISTTKNFSSHTFPQAQTLQPQQNGKTNTNADVENPSYNRGDYSQFLQALGKEGETKPMANTLRSDADNATIEIYPYTRQDLRNPETGKQILTQLYWKEGLSSCKIATMFGSRDDTICYLLRKYSIARRNRIEVLTKLLTLYEKKPFSGDAEEKAYLLGLRSGDIDARIHHRHIRAETATTHPAMLKLFEEAFGHYGHITRRPAPVDSRRYGSYECRIECGLDMSFTFLVEKPKAMPEWIETNKQYLLCFLAGFIDTDGCIQLRPSRKKWVGIAIELYNTNLTLLDEIKENLERIGYHSNLTLKAKRGTYNYTKDFWQLTICKSKAVRLLPLLPLRHSEKQAKRELALAVKDCRWQEIAERVAALRIEIKKEVEQCVEEAKRAWLAKHSTT